MKISARLNQIHVKARGNRWAGYFANVYMAGSLSLNAMMPI